MTTNSTFARTLIITVFLSTIFIGAKALGTGNDPQQVSQVSPLNNLPCIYAFDAFIIDNKSINLNWMTKSEKNDIHFEVERSFDNSNFKTVALILDGFSTDVDQKSYKFKENKTELKGKTQAYYRLKQIEANGAVKFSKTLTVSFPTI